MDGCHGRGEGEVVAHGFLSFRVARFGPQVPLIHLYGNIVFFPTDFYARMVPAHVKAVVKYDAGSRDAIMREALKNVDTTFEKYVAAGPGGSVRCVSKCVRLSFYVGGGWVGGCLSGARD